ncbi:metallophosphoesterase [Pantoea coffeiphila]|uniref:metallophosphoesterase n=1 Tax=Pantoea coffeiphila TaxID=1465635 RepID=UPI001960E31D|nr:metallophosphoesterase [Pantoea coffeiphila]MBM7345608.1 3',5'-cyclic AMP phosphodiesterase CpdA [Pantoea coffeiphila]
MSLKTLPNPLSQPQRLALGEAGILYQLPAIRSPDPADSTLRFGLIADPQYADADPDVENNLYYRHGLCKLSSAISALNDLSLDFVATLGDLVDRHWSSYSELLPRYDALHHPHVAVIGNHDAQVISEHLAAHTPPLGLPKSYYHFRLSGYRFLVIDGNDISLYCNAGNGDDLQQAREQLDELIAQQQPQAQRWNGAVGEKQMAWIEQNLQQAQALGETVIVFGHYPLAPLKKHILWNGEVVADLLCRYQVRAYFAGHDHRGGYYRRGNTDFITLKGMLDGPDNVPFAVAELNGNRLIITGFGGEISRILPLSHSEPLHEVDSESRL